MSIALLIAGAAIFLLGMLAGACVFRLRVTKFGNRMLVEIGASAIDPLTGSEVRSRRWLWAVRRL